MQNKLLLVGGKIKKMIDLKLISLVAALATALCALFIIILDIYNEGTHNKKVKFNLVLYFASHILTLFCYFIYFYTPEYFIWVNWLLMLNLVLVPIFLYAFIYKITAISSEENLPQYHYIAPVSLSIIMIILSFTTPFKEQILTIKGNGLYRGDSLIFYIFSTKLFFRLIINIVYIILTIKRLPRYRKYITSYTANDVKSSLRWVTILILFLISLAIIPLHGLFLSRSALAISGLTFLQVLLLIVQMCFLVYHVIKGHYIIQEQSIEDNPKDKTEITQKETNPEIEKTISEKKQQIAQNPLLSKKIFENYINKHKPYLNANIKIIDLAEGIGINRSYLSIFINTEYDVNFSSFINNFRLQEYNRLRSLDKYKSKSNAELAEMAGFGSYRSYARFVTLQNEKINPGTENVPG